MARFTKLRDDVVSGTVPRAAAVTHMLNAAKEFNDYDLWDAHEAFEVASKAAKGKAREELFAGLEGLLRKDVNSLRETSLRLALDALAPTVRKRDEWLTAYLRCATSEWAISQRILALQWDPKAPKTTREFYLAMLAAQPLDNQCAPPPELVPLVLESMLDVVVSSLSARDAGERLASCATFRSLLVNKANFGAELAARLASQPDAEVLTFLDAASRFRGYSDDETKLANATLKAALEPVLTGRELKLSSKVEALFRTLGFKTTGPKPVLQRELPSTMTEALDFLATRGVKLKPTAAVPAGLPRDLAAFYARATSLPPFIVRATSLAKEHQALLREIARAELDEGPSLEDLSDPKRWVALGSDSSGDRFFLDPRYPKLTFRFRHDEQLLDVEPCLAQLICWFGASDWADETGMGDRLAAAYLAAHRKAQSAWKKRKR